MDDQPPAPQTPPKRPFIETPLIAAITVGRSRAIELRGPFHPVTVVDLVLHAEARRMGLGLRVDEIEALIGMLVGFLARRTDADALPAPDAAERPPPAQQAASPRPAAPAPRPRHARSREEPTRPPGTPPRSFVEAQRGTGGRPA